MFNNDWPDDEYGTDYHLAHGLEPPRRKPSKTWLMLFRLMLYGGFVGLAIGIVSVLLWLIQDTCR